MLRSVTGVSEETMKQQQNVLLYNTLKLEIASGSVSLQRSFSLLKCVT